MEALLLAAQAPEPEDRSGLFLILPEPAELIWGAISFAVLVFLIWRFVGPALQKTVEARQQAITGRLDEAEQAKQEAESLLEDYRKQLADARSEANRIIEEARKTADSLRKDMSAKAESEADQIVRRARQEVSAERERAIQELRDEVAQISLDLAEKVVEQNLDHDLQKNLVDRYLRELEEMAK
jgi:F-type H+-transporting ATPase subunit b